MSSRPAREDALISGSARTSHILAHGGRIAAIQRLVVQQCGLPPGAMTSRCRSRSLARARQVAMYLARELTPFSSLQIARAFQRDHTTVLHACRTVAALMRTDPDFAAEVAALRAQAQQAG